MIYIISIMKNSKGEVLYYRGFDAHSESTMNLDTDSLKYILHSNRLQVANATIQDDRLVINGAFNGIHTESNKRPRYIEVTRSGPSYMLIANEGSTYKLVGYTGIIAIVRAEAEMHKIVGCAEVSNCRLVGNKIEAMNIYEIHRDAAFEKLMQSKYDIFIAKTTMLGYKNITFDYIIENHEVKLRKYTGSNNDVILPTFITAIMYKAFTGQSIQTIRLNEGLKVIGEAAFYGGSLSRVEIPASVELIGLGAFGNNKKLFRDSYYMNTDRFKLRNNTTIVLDQGV